MYPSRRARRDAPFPKSVRSSTCNSTKSAAMLCSSCRFQSAGCTHIFQAGTAKHVDSVLQSIVDHGVGETPSPGQRLITIAPAASRNEFTRQPCWVTGECCKEEG